MDTPRHLDALAEDIARHGIRTPLRLGFCEEFGTIEGNHRIAVALRLGLTTVPVTVVREPNTPRPAHARPGRAADFAVLAAAAGK
ncbi:ParB N-terminal domain-containing protein [Amycolatopsis dendrobii]|uniref:ParB N-terminal domain-containing protein n=1 Tax=Amycolatopsis dendrobii TaxID=2760662 RepID=A0A7W3VYG5_9PSEU|nr:ParB N-terminal domain-containing protein [Amycolatopsis dendrobii]MBB1155556.1 ParB N-terminal domain-containing protein [Amycolatopsis dendrobii]